MTATLALRSRRVVTPHGTHPATVRVENGLISAVEAWESGAVDGTVDLGDRPLLPGLVDTHVHVNEPGRSEWEGFATATRAAAAGGTTTLVDMPLNSIPPTTESAHLEAKRQAAAHRCWVDVGFWGGVVPGNLDSLAALWDEGVLGFKAFMCDSGVAEFPAADPTTLDRAARRLAELEAPLLVHAESPTVLAEAAPRLPPGAKPTDYETYLTTRPPEAEQEAIAELIEVCERHGTWIHVVHVADAGALPRLRQAAASGLPITAETCPHYLTCCAEEVPDGATLYKCAPPIRQRRHQADLWAALGDGTLSVVASDHSPAPPELKAIESGDFLAAWGGISSLELRLPVVWTEARGRGFGLDHVVEWLAAAPARLAGLAGRKGAIRVGCDADLCVFDSAAEWQVDPDRLLHRHPITPYAGRHLVGRVEQTFLRGRPVFTDGATSSRARGALLHR